MSETKITRSELDRTVIGSGSGGSLNGQFPGTNLLGGGSDTGAGSDIDTGSDTGTGSDIGTGTGAGSSSIPEGLVEYRKGVYIDPQTGRYYIDPSYFGGTYIPHIDQEGSTPEERKAAIDRLSDWNNRGSLVDVWAPDPNSSPEQNLSSLQEYISSLFSSSRFESPLISGSLFANILENVRYAVSYFAQSMDMDNASKAALVEKVSDLSMSFIMQQYTQALNYQSWYLQQEYNSPVNQVNRLTAAGLNSAFVAGSFGSGNAQQQAGVSQPQLPGNSGTGDIMRSGQANEQNFLSSLIQAGVSGVTGLSSAVGSLISAQATKKLSAKQIQLADSDIINNAATYELLRAQYQEVLQNQAYKDFDKEFDLSSQVVNQAAQRRDSAKLAYDTALHSMGDVEVQGFRTFVVDKSGHVKTVDIDYNEAVDSTKNNGYLKSGDRILGSETWENMTRQELDAAVNGEFGFGVPGIGKAKAGASVGTQLEHRGTRGGSNSKEQSKERQDGYETGQQHKEYKQGYDEHGRQFRIGESLFTSVTIKRPMSLTANKEYLDQCLKRYESALEEYNTLSTGERARLCDLLDHIQQGLGTFASRVVHTKYMNRVRSHFDPKTMIGD